jgi:hypothetical protein
MLGDTGGATRAATEAVRLLTPIGDAWGMVHAEAMLGAIANAEHRFGHAADALTRAAALSERLGFAGQAALHLTTLGRVQQRSGAPGQARDTLARAIQAAATAGGLRIAATARIHLARALRGAGDQATARTLLEANDRWYRASGGGDGALLTRHAATTTSRPRRWRSTPWPGPPPPEGTCPGRRGSSRRPTACTPRSGTPWTTPTARTRGPPARS